MIIAVCGNIASGKSTLAHYISNNYGFSYVPHNRSELPFLKDFFEDIPEKFLQTQLAFLSNKASQIHTLLKSGKNIVIDRSLEEDIQVFAKLWLDNYNIDERIKKLYLELASYIVGSLPNPELYIMCDCPPEISIQRLSQRPRRDFEDKYPPNHIEMLYKYMQKLKYPENSTVITINSAICNFTIPAMSEEVLQDIKKIIDCHLSNAFQQLTLYNYESITSYKKELSSKYITNCRIGSSINSSHLKQLRTKKKIVYLAAPFTALTIPRAESAKEMDTLITQSPTNHGILPLDYQKKLERIRKQIISSWNTDVILPHKDVNHWGHKDLSSDIVLRKIIENITTSNYIVAIPATSIGVHLELGIAIAQHKPIIIFEVENMKNSFYVPNLNILDTVHLYHTKTLDDIPRIIRQPELINLFYNNGGLHL